jgi:NAD(P)-dependent dehydrogenase (short-subunit alcohol dehydrogenase family)
MERGSTALITGGGSGIGAAVARRLARQGLSVWIAGRNQARCRAVAEDLREDGHVARELELDVTDADSIERALATALAAAEPVGYLVNSAGIALSAPLAKPKDAAGRDLYDLHLAVNFHGARRLIAALLPSMRTHEFGRIVNVASSAALRGYAYVAAYCASKHALLGYTRAAALELEGTGVEISAVCPHYVDTPLTDAAVENLVTKTRKSAAEIRAMLAAQNPGGRLISPDEVAAAIETLLAGGCNGWILELDGARVARVPEQSPT